MISVSAIIFALLASGYVQAANDWSVPCTDGTCSWDTGDGVTTAFSSMAIVCIILFLILTLHLYILVILTVRNERSN